MTAVFKIEQNDTSVFGLARHNLVKGNITLTPQVIIHNTYLWEMVSHPLGTTLPAKNTTVAVFDLSETGGYLFRLTVDKGMPTEDTQTLYAGIPLLHSSKHIPAFGETAQDNYDSNTWGYGKKLNDFLRWVDESLGSMSAGLTYMGTWNATTNTPSLTDGSGKVGYYYIVSKEGNTELDGVSDWGVGDWVISVDVDSDHEDNIVENNWQKIDNSDSVDSYDKRDFSGDGFSYEREPVRVHSPGWPAALDMTYNTTVKGFIANNYGSINDDGLDGVTNFKVGDRVVINVAINVGVHGGIYRIKTLGDGVTKAEAYRASDFKYTGQVLPGMFVKILEGSTWGGTTQGLAALTNIVVDTDPIVWIPYGGYIKDLNFYVYEADNFLGNMQALQAGLRRAYVLYGASGGRSPLKIVLPPVTYALQGSAGQFYKFDEDVTCFLQGTNSEKISVKRRSGIPVDRVEDDVRCTRFLVGDGTSPAFEITSNAKVMFDSLDIETFLDTPGNVGSSSVPVVKLPATSEGVTFINCTIRASRSFFNITAISKGTTTELTLSEDITASNGTLVFIDGVQGMSEVNGNYYRIIDIGSKKVTLTHIELDSEKLDSTSYTDYTGSGKLWIQAHNDATKYANSIEITGTGALESNVSLQNCIVHGSIGPTDNSANLTLTGTIENCVFTDAVVEGNLVNARNLEVTGTLLDTATANAEIQGTVDNLKTYMGIGAVSHSITGKLVNSEIYTAEVLGKFMNMKDAAVVSNTKFLGKGTSVIGTIESETGNVPILEDVIINFSNPGSYSTINILSESTTPIIRNLSIQSDTGNFYNTPYSIYNATGGDTVYADISGSILPSGISHDIENSSILLNNVAPPHGATTHQTFSMCAQTDQEVSEKELLSCIGNKNIYASTNSIYTLEGVIQGVGSNTTTGDITEKKMYTIKCMFMNDDGVLSVVGTPLITELAGEGTYHVDWDILVSVSSPSKQFILTVKGTTDTHLTDWLGSFTMTRIKKEVV